MNIKNILEETEANQKRVRMIQRTKKDGTTFCVPTPKRGNEQYAWKYGKKFLMYKQNFLQGIAENSIMAITLVTPYGNSYYECRDSWKTVHGAIGSFCKKINKIGKGKYLAVFEATSEGCCHAHIVFRWSRPLRVSVHNGTYYLAENDLSKAIRKIWIKEWMKVSERRLNNNSITVRISPNPSEAEKVFGYATKFLGYGSDITNELYRAQNNIASNFDLAKLFSNYWGFKLRIRLYRFSKDSRRDG